MDIYCGYNLLNLDYSQTPRFHKISSGERSSNSHSFKGYARYLCLDYN